MKTKNCCFRSIKQAMEHGRVIDYLKLHSYTEGFYYSIRIRYFRFQSKNRRLMVLAEWYECKPRYFESFVKKHRNFL